jgi:hypothetical protein
MNVANAVKWYQNSKAGNIIFYLCFFYLFMHFVEAYIDGVLAKTSASMAVVFVTAFVTFALIDLIRYLFKRSKTKRPKTNVVNVTTTNDNDVVTVVSKSDNTKVIINGEEK